MIATKAEFELEETKKRRKNIEAEKKRKENESKAYQQKEKDDNDINQYPRKKSLSGSLIGFIGNLKKRDDDDNVDLNKSQRLVMISGLVTKPTGQLPDVQERRERPKRTRAASDGVAAMRLNLFSTTSAAAERTLRTEDNAQSEFRSSFVGNSLNEKEMLTPEQRKARRHATRAKSQSVGVEQMRLHSSFNPDQSTNRTERKMTPKNPLSILHETRYPSQISSKDTNDSDSVSAGIPDDLTHHTDSNTTMESYIQFGTFFCDCK